MAKFNEQAQNNKGHPSFRRRKIFVSETEKVPERPGFSQFICFLQEKRTSFQSAEIQAIIIIFSYLDSFAQLLSLYLFPFESKISLIMYMSNVNLRASDTHCMHALFCHPNLQKSLPKWAPNPNLLVEVWCMLRCIS